MLGHSTTAPRKRALIVDDDHLMREMLSAVLARHDFQPLAVADVAEARSAISRSEGEGTPISLLLCDQNLSDGRGSDLCALLRHQGWQGKILLLSASVDSSMVSLARSSGIERILPKGTPLVEILNTCLKLMDEEPSKDPNDVVGRIPHHLVRRFLAKLEERRLRLESLSPTHDRELIRGLAHQLRGTAMLYGLANLSNAADRCELAASSESELPDLLAARHALLEELKAAAS